MAPVPPRKDVDHGFDLNGARHTGATCPAVHEQLDRIEAQLAVLVKFVQETGAALENMNNGPMGKMLMGMLGGRK